MPDGALGHLLVMTILHDEHPAATALSTDAGRFTIRLDSDATQCTQSRGTTSNRKQTHTTANPTRTSSEESAVTASVISLFPPPISAAIDGQLALPLTWDVSPGVSAVPETPPRLRLVGPAPEVDEPGPAGVDELELSWVARMARAIAEVGSGDRPAAQLTRWVERQELARLAARGQCATRHPAARGRRAEALRVRAAQQVRAIRLCPIRPGVVESSAVLVGAGRGRAIAMRFEHVADRWLVTAISLG